MTAKELAEMLDRREYREEITEAEAQRAAESGLVVIYGYSDENVELRGAIYEEVGAWEGTTIHFTPEGLLEEPACGIAENVECPYFTAAKSAAKTIKAVWHDEGGPCWTFETDIPHETFTVVEDGEPWCIGVVFSTEHLGNKEENSTDCKICGQQVVAGPVLHLECLTKLVTETAEKFCDSYCMWPNMYTSQEQLERERCDGCPMDQLMKLARQ